MAKKQRKTKETKADPISESLARAAQAGFIPGSGEMRQLAAIQGIEPGHERYKDFVPESPAASEPESQEAGNPAFDDLMDAADEDAASYSQPISAGVPSKSFLLNQDAPSPVSAFGELLSHGPEDHSDDLIPPLESADSFKQTKQRPLRAEGLTFEPPSFDPSGGFGPQDQQPPVSEPGLTFREPQFDPSGGFAARESQPAINEAGLTLPASAFDPSGGFGPSIQQPSISAPEISLPRSDWSPSTGHAGQDIIQPPPLPSLPLDEVEGPLTPISSIGGGIGKVPKPPAIPKVAPAAAEAEEAGFAFGGVGVVAGLAAADVAMNAFREEPGSAKELLPEGTGSSRSSETYQRQILGALQAATRMRGFV